MPGRSRPTWHHHRINGWGVIERRRLEAVGVELGGVSLAHFIPMCYKSTAPYPTFMPISCYFTCIKTSSLSIFPLSFSSFLWLVGNSRFKKKTFFLAFFPASQWGCLYGPFSLRTCYVPHCQVMYKYSSHLFLCPNKTKLFSRQFTISFYKDTKWTLPLVCEILQHSL